MSARTPSDKDYEDKLEKAAYAELTAIKKYSRVRRSSGFADDLQYQERLKKVAFENGTTPSKLEEFFKTGRR